MYNRFEFGIKLCGTLSKILSVTVGGAFGAVAPYLINVSPLASIFERFPFPTFFINISGSFLIGFLLVIFADKFLVSENLRLAVIAAFSEHLLLFLLSNSRSMN